MLGSIWPVRPRLTLRKLLIMNSCCSQSHNLGKVRGTKVTEAFGLSDVYCVYCTAPNSSVKVTHISRQCFVLGQLDGGLLAGDQDGKREGELPDASDSHRSFALWGGTSAWPSIWRLTPDVSSTRLLDLATMDMKLVAVNWNSRFSHSILGAKALARNKTNHLVWVSCILVTLFGTPFICHQ